MKKILFISLAVIIACGLLSFVGTSSNGNSNGPSITFKKDKHVNPTIKKMVYEDIKGLDYHDNKKVVIRNIERYKATTAYQGKNYVSTTTNNQSVGPQIALSNNSANYGISNGHRTGASNGLMAQNVSYNSFSNIKMRSRSASASTSNGSVVMTGGFYGAAEADHEHSVGDITKDGATCEHEGCDAFGEWTFNEATGVWGIEWKAPIGDVMLPILLMVLGYLLAVGIKRN